jgi:hypothetical protein
MGGPLKDNDRPPLMHELDPADLTFRLGDDRGRGEAHAREPEWVDRTRPEAKVAQS